jgi:hypothetical protein
MKTRLLSLVTGIAMALGAVAAAGQSAGAAEPALAVGNGPTLIRCRDDHRHDLLRTHQIRDRLRHQGFYRIGFPRFVRTGADPIGLRCGRRLRGHYQVIAFHHGRRLLVLVDARTGRPFSYRRA